MNAEARHSLWNETLRFSLGHWRVSILFLVPAAALSRAFHWHPLLVFVTASLALVPLASLLGDATEQLAGHVGPAAGGLLNAALGNVTELIIGIIALRNDQTEVVKASITGSIVGNLLLVFGLAAFVGGLGREKLAFNRMAAGANVSMLFVGVVALVMPALFQLSVLGSLKPTGKKIEHLSLWVAGVLLASYFSSFIFMFRTHRSVFRGERFAIPTIGKSSAFLALLAGTVVTALASEVLVSQIGFVTHALGWTELFVGIVIVATVGNAAEHSAAVMMARRGQMDLALNVAIGSSAQIALFVAPLLVLVSQLQPTPMSLVFQPLEIAAVILSVGVVAIAAADGETHWFEGLLLVGVYLILAVFFYFLPAVRQ
jgi:Ca2+:H+ antiporter